ncbi:HDOD domain-containing protein [Thalassotalea sp. M1531]|uniref:HDOD domain-containing protein n=1 Tax=Thalassotalea algicola TaxID=2716224 RepID=A0A7Y0LB47_9GAMM|nr:HDOD domain-containing protein [Thalassotalea algicola]NMP31181.1 HDOD domain-containing protein [Thalassotalea algicola]
MSSDVVVLLIVLIVCFVIFRKLNKSKTRETTVVSAGKNKVNYATKQAIESQRKQRQVASEVTTGAEQEELPVPKEFLDFSLSSYKALTSAHSAEIEAMLADFSKPHPLMLKLTSGIFEQKELSELIKSDPDITAKILTVVNSSQFSLQQPIKDINHAIIFLGVTQVKNIALQFAMQNSVEFSHPAQAKAYQKIWSASYLASQLALLLSKSLGKENASELSTLCLLLYLGDLVLLSAKPELAENYLAKNSFFKRLGNTQNIAKTNAAVVGYMLAKVWKLPTTMAEDMRYQYRPFTNSLASAKLEEEQVKDLMLCYIVCRLSDLVVFQGHAEGISFEALDFKKSNNLEFYHLAKNVSADRLSEIAKELQANNFTVKARELIARAVTS